MHQTIGDPELAPMIDQLMRSKAATSLVLAPGQDLNAYADALIERFKHPALNHRLAQIDMDGARKSRSADWSPAAHCGLHCAGLQQNHKKLPGCHVAVTNPCQMMPGKQGLGMTAIDVFLAADFEGDRSPFNHDYTIIRFHTWNHAEQLPLIEGQLWAFIGWALPDISGLELCRRLRAHPLTATAHITLVLDEDDQEDRKRALRAGADDYISAPLNRTKVLDRVLAAHLASDHLSPMTTISCGKLTIDVAAFQARWQGVPIALMRNEFRLLLYFMQHPGRVLTREQMIAALGKQGRAIDARTVDVWVGRLRRALKAEGVGDPLRTVRTLGYVFDAPNCD